MPDHPTYHLTLAAIVPFAHPDDIEGRPWEPILRLRVALKRLRRCYGLECIEAVEVKPVAKCNTYEEEECPPPT